MLLNVALGKLAAFCAFLVLACVLRIGIVPAGIAAILLCFARIEFEVSIKFAVVLGIVAVVTQSAANNPLACMAGNFVCDLLRARTGSLAYRLFGGFVPLADEGAPLLRAARAPGIGKVQVVRTTKAGERLAEQPNLLILEDVRIPSAEPTVALDPSVTFQTFMGFGGSFTETSAEVWQKLPVDLQQLVLKAYFDEETGIGYKLGRVHIGACDFSEGNWSLIEENDTDLKTFSIDRYEIAILPMIRQATEYAKEPLKLMASPWSPPAWMKDIGRMKTGGKLLPEYREVWARHYIKFVEAFKKAGVPLWSLTVQNEPHASTPWENCLYTHEEERDFVRDFLGPALEKSNIEDIKLLVWDHNRDDMFLRAKTIYSDPIAEKYVWGVAYHWYGDPRYEMWPPQEGMVVYDNLRKTHELRPAKHIVMSEACQEFGPRIGDWKVGERYGEAIIRDLNNYLEAWIDWNLLLDTSGGPNHASNFVTAPILADLARRKVLFHTNFYYLAHFSRFIKPGAQRILSSPNRDALEVTAFKNTDGSIAAVVMNQGNSDISFWLELGGKAAKTDAPKHSITTFLLQDER